MITHVRGAVLAVLFVTAPPALAASLPVTRDLAASGWRPLEFPGFKATEFHCPEDGVIEVVARDSSSMLYRQVPEAQQRKRHLVWRWRVDTAPPATDLTRRGRDDRPLALHVAFAEEDGRGGLFGALTRDLIDAMTGAPAHGKVLTYVWGGTQRPGDRFANPHLDGNGVMIVLRDGATPQGEWFKERIDLAADFERAFGRPPPSVAFIAVSGDSDDEGGLSRGRVAAIMLADG
ncbi:MAG: DUF3047 domain-containing protein [Alphaproteobacteria bacterium]|nr:DUF3047 domain-containing protein [Alphaproteobacteria bacterium]